MLKALPHVRSKIRGWSMADHSGAPHWGCRPSAGRVHSVPTPTRSRRCKHAGMSQEAEAQKHLIVSPDCLESCRA